MFTGLVEALGTICAVRAEAAGRRLIVAEPKLAVELEMGESVAVNGVCLTVVALHEDSFAFEVGPETLAKTNLGQLRTGERVNLERALRVGDRLGGHWVQGHVDGTGSIASRAREGDWETVWFDCPAELARQMVPKGSVAVDGVSLTLVEVEVSGFSVMLIPHTLAQTTLGLKGVGAIVNLETDILAKYVEKYLAALKGSP
jgi:riboflavin synthase